MHEVLRFRLVVARQVDELERSPDDGAEELLAADGAADDEVARVDAALAQTSGGLDELAEALRRVDEPEERDDRELGRKPERRARGGAVSGPEALQVDGVRDDRRADAEYLGDVAVDRDRRGREFADGAADEGGAFVLALLRQRRAEMPHDRKAFAAREKRGRNERRVVEVHELEPLASQRTPELVHVARQPDELAAEQEPAPTAVCRRPDVREARDGAGVDDRARLLEEIRGRPGRAIDVGLELLTVELPDEVRE